MTAKTVHALYQLEVTWPVTADLDLELWRGSTKVASSYSTTAKPETVSAASQPAGTYTIKVISKNYAASYTATATRPLLDWADLTLELRNASNQVLKSSRSASGSISFTHTLPAAGNYTLKITNHSSDLNVPSYTSETVLPRALPALARLEVKTQAGAVVASSEGASPRAISGPVVAGAYRLVITPTQGTAAADLAASYPGRVAKMLISYDGNDHAKQIDDGTTITAETLSPSGQVLRRTIKDSITLEVLEDVIVGYDGDGDSPAYERPYAGGTVTTYLAGADGLLVIDTGGTASYPLSNAHGDIAGTTDAAGVFTAAPVADEFGVAAETSDTRLGWLGKHQRYSTGGGLKLVRMGVRLYDPLVGRFHQVDPVEGGSANDYAYVYGEPVNAVDLDGQRTQELGGAGGGGVVINPWAICWWFICPAGAVAAGAAGVHAGGPAMASKRKIDRRTGLPREDFYRGVYPSRADAVKAAQRNKRNGKFRPECRYGAGHVHCSVVRGGVLYVTHYVYNVGRLR